MAWVGSDGTEAPVPMSLIAKALSLFRYVLAGQPVPYAEKKTLRAQTTFESRKDSYRYQTILRQTIGEMAMRGELITLGRDAGPTVMDILCGTRNARILSVILDLTKLLNFTLGGYNLKEMTSLALRADRWLEEMRGHNSSQEIDKRKRVETLRENLLDFLASTRKENYDLVLRERKSRAHEKTRKLVSEELLQASVEARASELEDLPRQIGQAWYHIKRMPTQEQLAELEEICKKIPLFEKAFRELERKLERRQQKQAKAEERLGRRLSEEECGQYRISDEEKKWRKETKDDLARLRRRADFIWAGFCQNESAEISLILSAASRLDELQHGGVS